jgi:hypothetical protein
MLNYDKAEFKKCSDCQTVKPRSVFSRNKSSPDGSSYLCKECTSLRRRKPLEQARHRSQSTKSRNNNYTQYRQTELRREMRKYGITLEQYEEMAAKGCAICGAAQGTTKRRLPVDHCHKTGKVRGVLCMFCNTAIGKFRDDPELCEKAAHYLRSHRSEG